MGINITHNTAIPLQKLPLSKKTPEWREACVDGFIGKATDSFIRGRSESEDLKIKYDLYNSKFNIKDIEYELFYTKVNSKKNPNLKFEKEQVCDKLIHYANVMPTYFLVEEEIEAIYHYIKNLNEKK